AADFAIQFSVRLRERRGHPPGIGDSLRATRPGGGAEILAATLSAGGGLAARRWKMLAPFVVLALGGRAPTLFISFDGDPLHTKDPKSEAIRTLHDLMQDPVTNPYTIEALLPSLGEAQTAADRLAALPLSQDVLTLNSFLPTDQDAKLA